MVESIYILALSYLNIVKALLMQSSCILLVSILEVWLSKAEKLRVD